MIQMVRRLALSALNSAARSRAHLIRDHLPTLLSSLYKETVVNLDLIRTVQMGPWTHKVDDGLDARKTAYETLYTLVSSALKVSQRLKYTHPTIVEHVPLETGFARVPQPRRRRPRGRIGRSQGNLPYDAVPTRPGRADGGRTATRRSDAAAGEEHEGTGGNEGHGEAGPGAYGGAAAEHA